MTWVRKRSLPLGRRTMIRGVGATVFAAPAVHAQGRTSGVALVIGNSKYHWEAPLPNVKRDAPDIARRFEAFGLKTELAQDLGRDAMRQAIARLASASKGADMAAFYFAGHGASWKRGTYLVPVDADLGNPDGVSNLVPLGVGRDGTREAANHLVVLDACRNNPADGWRQKEDEDRASSQRAEAGTQKDDPANMVLLFSTVPGRAALDGPAGQNSPFAAALLRQLAGAQVDLQTLPGRLRRDLLTATAGRQFVWDRNTYRQPYLLNGPSGTATAGRSGAAGDPSRIVELANANAYAQQNGLPMPSGLIACRPSAGSPHAGKAGAYKFVGYNQEPSLLVIMSVEDQQSAELLLGYRDNKQRAKWRIQRAALSGDSVEFLNPDGNLLTTFKWSDTNSGKLSMVPQGAGNSKHATGAFTRLD